MFIICGLIGFVVSFYIYLTWNYDYWVKRGVPSPKPKVLLGNLPNAVTRKEHVTYDLCKIYDEYKGTAPFVGIYQMRQPRLLLIEPALVRDVLITNFSSFHDNEFSKMIDAKNDVLLGNNPFLNRGDVWKEKRAEIAPGFSNNRLKALYPLIQNVQKKFSAYINEELLKDPKKPFDGREICAKYTTDVVSSCVFAADGESFTKKDPEIRAMSKKLMKPDGKTIFLIILTSIIPFLKRFVKVQFVGAETQNFFINLFEQALNYRKTNNVIREDFLDHLINLSKKKSMTTVEMAGHSITFFSDGLETSSVALAHTLYELGKNEIVQDKLRHEIMKHLTDNNGEINCDTLNDMEYLDQVMIETLRMHPPFTAISRECTVDTELISENGQKVLIEKGINIYIPTYQLQHDPEYYPDPEEFIPGRFCKENGGMKAFKDKGVFLTFGDGPRICLGMKFAQMQSKAATVEIVSNFQIKVNDKTQNPLVMDPKEFLNIKQGGLWLNFIPLEIKKTAAQ